MNDKGIDFSAFEHIPIERMNRHLRGMTAEQRLVAKERMRVHREEALEVLQEEWFHTTQWPENMKRPICVTIPSWQGAHTNGGVHVVSDRVPGYVHIRPGEVVCVDFEWPMVQKHFALKLIELTRDPINRPLVYPSKHEVHVLHPGRRNNYLGLERSTYDDVRRTEAKLVEQLQSQYRRCLMGTATKEEKEEVVETLEAQEKALELAAAIEGSTTPETVADKPSRRSRRRDS